MDPYSQEWEMMVNTAGEGGLSMQVSGIGVRCSASWKLLFHHVTAA
jgi:hypothetical protein